MRVLLGLLAASLGLAGIAESEPVPAPGQFRVALDSVEATTHDSSVVGTVTGPAGALVPHAAVALWYEPYANGAEARRLRGYSDANGRYAFRELSPGLVAVSATDLCLSEHSAGVKRRFLPHTELEVPLTLHHTLSLAIRVRGADGQTVRVDLDRRTSHEQLDFLFPCASESLRHAEFADGGVAFEALAPGDYVVLASCKGFADCSVELSLVDRDREVEVRFTEEEPDRSEVVDRDGVGEESTATLTLASRGGLLLPAGIVRLRWADGGESTRTSDRLLLLAEIRHQTSGRCINLIAPRAGPPRAELELWFGRRGTCDVEVDVPGHRPHRETMEVRENGAHRIELDPLPGVSVRGELEGTIWSICARRDGGPWQPLLYRRAPDLSHDGRLVTEGWLEPGTWDLRYASDAGVESVVPGIEVLDGGPGLDLTAPLANGIELAAQWLDATCTRVDAPLFLERREGEAWVPCPCKKAWPGRSFLGLERGVYRVVTRNGSPLGQVALEDEGCEVTFRPPGR